MAIDKPPVDLWLQVASTRLLGFNGVALLLPEALGGIALVAALMWLLRTLLGRTAALAGGLALAVAPSAVVVARSDTMDAVMAALAVAGAAVVARAARSGSRWPLVGAGVLLGLAFEVKLAEALLPVAAAAALWWFAGPRAPRPRALGLGLLGGAFVASALAWLVLVSVVPLHPRPWALGASDGSPWRAALVYNGTARLLGRAATPRACLRGGPPRGRRLAASPGARASRVDTALARRAREHAAAVERRPAPAGPLRLSPRRPIWVAGSGSRPSPRWRPSPSRWRSEGAGLGASSAAGCSPSALWLVAGLALCSAMPVCAALPGLRRPRRRGLPGRGRRARRPRPPAAARLAGAAALCAVLALPLATAVAAVTRGVQVSARPGDAGGAGRRPVGLPAAHAVGVADEVAVSARPRRARSSPATGAPC